jgi:hypothetical protein
VSKESKTSNPPRICQNPDCSAIVTGRVDRLTCSQKCRNAVKIAKRAAVIKTRNCEVCQKSFIVSAENRKLCSDDCRDHQHKRQLRNSELRVYAVKDDLRGQLIAAKTEDQLRQFGRDITDAFINDAQVRSAYYYQSQIKKSKPNNITKNPPRRKLKADRRTVMVYCSPTSSKLRVGIFKGSVAHSFNRAGETGKNIPILNAGTSNMDLATKRKAEIERILAYDDDRTSLLLEHGIIIHNDTEAKLLLGEITLGLDAFEFMKLYCKVIYKKPVHKCTPQDLEADDQLRLEIGEQEYSEQVFGMIYAKMRPTQASKFTVIRNK